MPEGTFEFSGLPAYLEWYECYNDLSSKRWLSGDELIQHRDAWDERAIAKWHFFYRPFRPVVGRPQKKRINERQATICVCEDYTRQAEGLIASEKVRLRRVRLQLQWWLAGLALTAVIVMQAEKWLLLLPALLASVVFVRLWRERSDSHKKIAQYSSQIVGYQATIRRAAEEIRRLEEEIAQLLAQIPRPVGAATIKQWFAEEIAEAELTCLSELAGTQVTRENARKYMPQDFGDPRVFGLLVDSWGYLQPASQRGPFGPESTGLRRAQGELRDRIATWQVGSGGEPVFRLSYLQYVIPFAKNLNTCSFFYDFLTRREYGRRVETFQYNHVTNYSIRELDPEEGAGNPTGSGLMQGKVLKALTIAVSSGNHFQCVLVDEDVVEFLNEWMKNEEKYRQLEQELPSDEVLRQRFSGVERLMEAWKTQEQARIEEEMRAVAQDQQELRLHSARTARSVLDTVRSCVENYVSQFERPA